MELPATEYRQFDYNTIYDVIMHVRYTSIDGGDRLREAAGGSITEFMKVPEELGNHEGLFAAFDLKHDFPTEWHKAMNPVAGATKRTLSLPGLAERLPFYTQGRELQLRGIQLISSANLAPNLSLTNPKEKKPSTPNITLAEIGNPIGELHVFSKELSESPFPDIELTFNDTATDIKTLWLVLRYGIKSQVTT